MDQGPQPMRNLKPVEKNLNGADQFNADHQAKYEDESRENEDRIREVDTHNAAFPNMRDELERRRSTAKATPPQSVVKQSKEKESDQTYYDPNCCHCQKKKMENKRKEKKRKSKDSDAKKRRSAKKTRVTKPKRAKRKTRSTVKLARLRTNQDCHYYYKKTNNGPVFKLNRTCPTIVTNDDELNKSKVIFFSKRNTQKSTDQNSRSGSTNCSVSVDNVSKTGAISCAYPDTSVNSFSSYNSNMSLDHEPMVSP